MLPDIIAMALVVLAVFKGLRKGFIVAVFSFFAFFIGLAAALKLSAVAAAYIGEAVSVSQRWLPFVAFFLVFLVVVLLIRLGAILVEKISGIIIPGWINRVGGILFYLLIYFFIFSIFVFYAAQLGILKPDVIESSTACKIAGPFAPGLIDALGRIFPIFSEMFAQLLAFFQDVSDKTPVE